MCFSSITSFSFCAESIGTVPNIFLWGAAIGSSFGIISLVVSIVVLFVKDRNKQKQLSQLFTLNENLSKAVEKLNNLTELQIQQNRPYFKLTGEMPLPPYGTNQYTIQNIGAAALEVSIFLVEGNCAEFTMKRSLIPAEGYLDITVNYKDNMPPEDLNFTIAIHFRNSHEVKYVQMLFKTQRRVELTPPIRKSQ
ncbi:MAG: hypothetical protein M0Q26_13540 [Chitinophagaceae bacterium]|nr:hypothetical protein [Chitinophagaceae bacterium]